MNGEDRVVGLEVEGGLSLTELRLASWIEDVLADAPSAVGSHPLAVEDLAGVTAPTVVDFLPRALRPAVDAVRRAQAAVRERLDAKPRAEMQRWATQEIMRLEVALEQSLGWWRDGMLTANGVVSYLESCLGEEEAAVPSCGLTGTRA